jgi:predicted DNA-binding transcriptional regulator AlpA
MQLKSSSFSGGLVMASTREVVAQLGMKYQGLYNMLHLGIIPKPAKKFGNGYAWTPEEVEAAKKIIAERRGEAVAR